MPSEIVQPKTYVRTFFALMVLLVLTVGASFVHLGGFGLVVSMLISVAKAFLILLFFMEVRYSRKIVWLFATAAILWFIMMLIFLYSDYATRSWVGPDWRAANGGRNHIEFTHRPR